MKNKQNLFKYVLTFFVLIFFGCETIDLDQTVDPDEVSKELLDPVYAFNYIQVRLPEFVEGANGFTQQLTRQMAMTGGKTYDNAFSGVTANGTWRTAYRILNAVKIMEPKAIERNQFHIIGASKVIEAYVMLTLVDLFGDVPYSEAFLGNQNLNPKYDKAVDVYKKALLKLDEAIVNLNNPDNTSIEQNTAYDLYYPANTSTRAINAEKWKTLARTLKFRAYVTARKAGSDLGVNINAELASLLTQDLIDTAAEDFQFKYSIDNSIVDSRHPLYAASYISGGNPPYISNYMLWTMVREKPTLSTNPAQADNNLTDPRTRYYFYNQVANADSSDSFDLPCKTSSKPDHYSFGEYNSFFRSNRGTPFCTVKTSTSTNSTPFWGADHGYSVGRPQDATKVTIVGLYPAGGKIGGGSSPQTSIGTAGEKGAGITPIILSSYVQFLKAEVYYAVFSDPASAKTQMDLAINASFEKASKLFTSAPALITTEVNNYLTFVDTFYDQNPDKQLELIMKEFFIASWGNGIEAYNNYRRTGFPSNMQPTLEPYPGEYYSTMIYPDDSRTNNQNAPAENVRTRKTFWDVNSPILH